MKTLNITRLLTALALTLLGGLFFSQSMAHAEELYYVNTTVDENDGSCADGDCSLRDALLDPLSDGYFTVYIPAGTYTLDTATFGSLQLVDHAVLRGAGSDLTIIEAAATPGTASDRVLTINSTDDTISMRGMTIRHGVADDGDNLTDSADDNGGGISFVGYGDLVLKDVIVEDNQSAVYGGGIHFEGTSTDYGIMMALRDTTIQNNTSGDDGGGFYFRAFDNGDGVVIDNTDLLNNVAGGDGGGGAIDADFNSVYAVWTEIVQGSQIIGNQAQNDGGGLYIYDYDSMTITVRDALFEENEAGLAGGTWDGGGMYIYDNDYGYMLIENTTFRSNSTTGDGGGLFDGYSYQTEIQNAVFENNTAGDEGGGAYLGGGYGLDMYDSTVTGNTAAYGGGLYVDREPGYIENTTITGNTATVDGGGLDLDAGYDIQLKDVDLSGNYAVGAGQACTGSQEIDSLGGNIVDDLTGCTANVPLIQPSDQINLLDDFSFEYDDASWTNNATNGVFFTGGSAYQGDNFFLFNADGGLDFIRQQVPYGGEIGDTVTLRLYAAGVDVPDNIPVGMRVVLQGPGGNEQRGCGIQSGTTSWTEITCSKTATAAFDTVLIQIGWDGATTGQLAIDYVRVDIDDPILFVP